MDVSQLDDTWGLFGTVSEDYTTVFRAELHAAVEALRHAAPPVTIHADNQQLVAGGGQVEACSPPIALHKKASEIISGFGNKHLWAH